MLWVSVWDAMGLHMEFITAVAVPTVPQLHSLHPTDRGSTQPSPAALPTPWVSMGCPASSSQFLPTHSLHAVSVEPGRSKV